MRRPQLTNRLVYAIDNVLIYLLDSVQHKDFDGWRDLITVADYLKRLIKWYRHHHPDMPSLISAEVTKRIEFIVEHTAGSCSFCNMSQSDYKKSIKAQSGAVICDACALLIGDVMRKALEDTNE